MKLILGGLLLTSILSTAGCGQSGPLYLPPPPSPPSHQQATPPGS